MAHILLLIRTVVAALLGFLAVYWKTSEMAQKKEKQTFEATQFITDSAITYIEKAEELYAEIPKSGATKFNWVVDTIMLIVPDYLEWIITKDLVEDLVQKTFDRIEKYATTQLENLTTKKGVK